MDVNALFQQAVAAGASDIHIEPLDEFVRIRWRKDGVLHTAGKLPRQRLESLVSRIKVLAGLDIANRRLPQDGRIVWNDGSGVSTFASAPCRRFAGRKSSSASSTASVCPWSCRPSAWTVKPGPA